MRAVFKREMRGLFGGMTAWAALALMAACVSVGMYIVNIAPDNPMFSAGYLYMYAGMALLCGVTGMGAFPGERRMRTERALFALPLSSASIYIGKYLARLVVAAVGGCLLACYALIMNALAPIGSLSESVCLTLGVACLGAVLTAMSVTISAGCRSDAVALAVYAVCAAILYFLPDIADLVANVTGMSPVFLIALPALVGIAVWQVSDNVIAGFAGAAVVLAPMLLCDLRGNDSAVFSFIARIMREVSVFDRLMPFARGVMDGGTLLIFAVMAAVLAVSGIVVTANRRACGRRPL